MPVITPSEKWHGQIIYNSSGYPHQRSSWQKRSIVVQCFSYGEGQIFECPCHSHLVETRLKRFTNTLIFMEIENLLWCEKSLLIWSAQVMMFKGNKFSIVKTLLGRNHVLLVLNLVSSNLSLGFSYSHNHIWRLTNSQRLKEKREATISLQCLVAFSIADQV